MFISQMLPSAPGVLTTCLIWMFQLVGNSVTHSLGSKSNLQWMNANWNIIALQRMTAGLVWGIIEFESIMEPFRIYTSISKDILNLMLFKYKSLKWCLILAGNLKGGKPMLCCFFFNIQHIFLH